MNRLLEVKNEKIKNVFIILFFGALWGIIEASLGTILHLPMMETTKIFLRSTTVIVPIAFLLMMLCYKFTNSKIAPIYMAIIAGGIKLSTGLMLGFIPQVYDPALYMVVESLCLCGALYVFKPDRILSLKNVALIAFASTLYQLSYSLLALAQGDMRFLEISTWQSYLGVFNLLIVLYSFIGGSVAYGINKLLKGKNLSIKFDFKKYLVSPLGATCALFLAVTLTFIL